MYINFSYILIFCISRYVVLLSTLILVLLNHLNLTHLVCRLFHQAWYFSSLLIFIFFVFLCQSINLYLSHYQFIFMFSSGQHLFSVCRRRLRSISRYSSCAWCFYFSSSETNKGISYLNLSFFIQDGLLNWLCALASGFLGDTTCISSHRWYWRVYQI